MLATYPIVATTDNWISETLLDMTHNALEALQRGEEPPEFQNSIPELYRTEFVRGRKFPSLYKSFVDLCRPLDETQRQLVLVALAAQNHFPGLYARNTPCPSIAVTLPAVHEAAKELFEYAFEKLSSFKTPGSASSIRENYHLLVHPHFDNGCCPFCGMEFLEAPDPDLVNPDLDHYLAISKYPFAGANLRNLTAMGTTCNRSYKGAQDILHDEHNQKIDCMDPYGNDRVTVSLQGTVLLPGGGQGPAWMLTFNPDAVSRNWRRVFNLETRLKVNILENNYQNWLRHYVSYAQGHGIDISKKAGAHEAIKKFKNTCYHETLPIVAVLKVNFFEMIESLLEDPLESDRIHNFVMAVYAA